MAGRKAAQNWRLYTKMFLGGSAICIGGPALTYYVMPTEEELFLRYNPELQKRSLENRIQNQEDFDKFVTKLKEYSKSDRPIWMVAADAERAAHESKIQQEIKDRQAANQEELRDAVDRK